MDTSMRNQAMGDIRERLINVIHARFPDAEIEEGTTLGELGGDSLDAIELIMEVEEEFDIEIRDDDAERLSSFGEAGMYLESKLR